MRISKKERRLKRASRSRFKMAQLGKTRLVVHRTLCHIYAQVITPNGKVIAAASTLEKEFRGRLKRNISSAREIGLEISKRAKAAGVESGVVFDRSGYLFHGCLKALAEAARESGLII